MLDVPLNSYGHVGALPTFYVTSTQHQDVKTQYGAVWRKGRVSDSGPRGPGFDPQLGNSSLWP